MTYTRGLLKFLFVVAITTTAIQNKGYASAFPVRPGRLLLSPSATYFFADKEWDSTGVKKSFPGNGKFTSQSYSLYAEYGISRRFSAVALLPYVVNNYTQGSVSYPSSGLTDMETGLKYYLANINYIYYFAIQGTAITPLYSSQSLGYAEEGAEFKLSFAGSGELFDRNYYFNIDNAIRQYFGNGGPLQYRYNGTFGITLDKLFKNQLSVSLGGFYTTSNFKQFNVINPYTNKNFSFTQASLSYGHAFSHDFSVFLTGGQFITGRNTSVGTSASIAIVYRIGGI